MFCLANSLSLEFSRTLHGTDLPRFAKLAEPAVTFFELPTGHHPMLSTPVEPADVLVRAVAGDDVGLHKACTARRQAFPAASVRGVTAHRVACARRVAGRRAPAGSTCFRASLCL
ncbi:hypothetical protein [Streptomyces roseoverticillatus]|uniref:Uncharacterized protein n=1 Tax=Streptomyces roseoverticillatus TaxID=66429 RepID=A0ABV3IPL8_9ACTN